MDHNKLLEFSRNRHERFKKEVMRDKAKRKILDVIAYIVNTTVCLFWLWVLLGGPGLKER